MKRFLVAVSAIAFLLIISANFFIKTVDFEKSRYSRLSELSRYKTGDRWRHYLVFNGVEKANGKNIFIALYKKINFETDKCLQDGEARISGRVNGWLFRGEEVYLDEATIYFHSQELVDYNKKTLEWKRELLYDGPKLIIKIN